MDELLRIVVQGAVYGLLLFLWNNIINVEVEEADQTADSSSLWNPAEMEENYRRNIRTYRRLLNECEEKLRGR